MWTHFCVLVTVLVSVNCWAGNDLRKAAVDDSWLCCSPKQWEGNFGEIGSISYKEHKVGYWDHSRFSYDDTKQFIAVDQHYVTKEHKGEVKFILRFGEKKMYIIYGEDKCKVKDITFPYKPACIRSDAKKLGSTFIGAGSAKLDVSSYYVGKKGYYEVVTTVSAGCIPVSEMNYFQKGDVKSFKQIGFFGIEGGIKNATVFDVPSFCKSANNMQGIFVDDLQFQPKDRVQEMLKKDVFAEAIEDRKDVKEMIEYLLNTYTSK